MKFRLVLEAEQKEPGTSYDVAIRAIDPPVLIAGTTHTNLETKPARCPGCCRAPRQRSRSGHDGLHA